MAFQLFSPHFEKIFYRAIILNNVAIRKKYISPLKTILVEVFKIFISIPVILCKKEGIVSKYDSKFFINLYHQNNFDIFRFFCQ